MTKSENISPEWLADRFALHDAVTLSAGWDGSTLKVEIDDDRPNLFNAEKTNHSRSGGWLVFEGAQIIHGDLGDVPNRHVSELRWDDGRWMLYLARTSLLSKRGLLAFSAQNATFEPKS